MNRMKSCCYTFLILFFASTALGQSTFTPLKMHDQNFESQPGLWLRPFEGTSANLLPLKTREYATQESVTGGSALKFIFEKGSPALFSVEKSANKYPKGSAGITFYAKASRPLTLAVGSRNPDKAAKASVTTDWKKFDLPWSALGDFPWQTYFTVQGPIQEKTWLIIDRLGTEAPTFDKNPKIHPQTGPDKTISSKEILYGRKNLAKTLHNLKNKKPIKIIAIGDSVTAGAQINRGNWDIKEKEALQFLYYNQFARLLKEHFADNQITVIPTGVGGQRLPQGLARLDKDVLSIAGPDDLVIIEFGANDMGWGGDSPQQWHDNLKKMIDRIKTKTDQIIVMSPTIGGKIPQKADQITQQLQQLVQEQKIAGADITKLSMYRGPAFAWSLLANEYHPDIMGHIWIAQMMAPLLTGQEQTYPQ